MSERSGRSRSNIASTIPAALVLPVLAVHLASGCARSGFGGGLTGEVDAGTSLWVDADPSGGGDPVLADAAVPSEACDKMDILFVVDDSLSMAEEQANLAAKFPSFIDLLDQRTGGSGAPLDYRVAVTTTGRTVHYTVIRLEPLLDLLVSDVGANGVFVDDPACGAPRPWLERGDPDVAGTFSCLAQVGTGGPNLEMPLLATKLALVDRVTDGTNAGFLRDDALLALVILTDEDDCSRQDDNFEVGSFFSDACTGPEFDNVDNYVELLDAVKDGRWRWAAAVIAGPGPGVCESDSGISFEARRLQTFVSDAGNHAVFSSICEGDLTSGLMSALDTFEEACRDFPPVP